MGKTSENLQVISYLSPPRQLPPLAFIDFNIFIIDESGKERWFDRFSRPRPSPQDLLRVQGTSVDSKLGTLKGKDPLNGSSLGMERGAPILDISADRFGQYKSH